MGVDPGVEGRARLSQGRSDDSVHRMVAEALAARGAGGVLVDVGCGSGRLWESVRPRFARYVGIDAAAYPGWPAEAEFHAADLDGGRLPLSDASADVAAAVETIEHLENPRALMRELVRVVKPGGWVVVTTPNILSLLGILNFVLKRRFASFEDESYPAHITPVMELDLRRMARECGLGELSVAYSLHGRIPGTPFSYPRPVAALWPRLLSDTLLLAARKPA